MSRATVLFFAADPFSAPPGGGPRLQLDRDVRLTREKVRGAPYHKLLTFDYWLAARPDDLIQGLNEQSPRVVHFSGHGTSDGLVLEATDGSPHLVSSAALEDLFDVFRGDIQVVFLNACLSLPQARAIAAVVGCAIGTGRRISDEAAMTFAASFYRALAFGHSVQTAFKQARVALKLEHPGEEETPQIISAPGVDPDRIFVIRGEGREGTTAPGEGSAAADRAHGSVPPRPAGAPSSAERPGAPAGSLWADDAQAPASHPERRPGRWIGIAVLAALALLAGYALREPGGWFARTGTQADSTVAGAGQTSPSPVAGDTVAPRRPEVSVPSARGPQAAPQDRRADPPATQLNPQGSAPGTRLDPQPEASSVPASSSTDEPRLSPPATGSVVERQRINIGGSRHRSYDVVITDARPCRLRGRVETLEGGSRDIDILVLDEDAFELFRQSHRYEKIFEARRTSEISLDVPLPGPGRYHFVVSNVFSAFTGKLVLVENVRWECAEGAGNPPA